SAYDIRSGISALTDEGVAAITGMSLVTARATKSTGEEMTSLTASAYGIFKNQYKDLSDIEWGEQFTAGLAASVKAYKTNGAAMQMAIQAAKGGAATLGMGMAEEMAILGTLQASMKGAEAGTALKSYAANAAKAHMAFKEAGININVLDRDGMLRDTQLVLKDIKAQYGSLDAYEMTEIKKAFGTDEAVNLINALIENQNTYSSGFKEVTEGMKQGNSYINAMAALMDDNGDAELQQSMEDWAAMKRDLGYALLPVFQAIIPVLKSITGGISKFAKEHKLLVGILGTAVVIFGVLAATMGAVTIAMAAMMGPFAMLKFAKTTMIFKTGLLSKAMSGLGFALKWVARSALPFLIAGMKVLARVFLLNPIGLAITAIAVGAFLIIKYWKPITGWFGRMFKKLKTMFAFTPLGLLMRGFGAAFKWLVKLIKTPGTAAQKTWAAMKTIFAWSPLGLLTRGIGKAIKLLAGLFKGVKFDAKSTWDYFKSLFSWNPIGLLMMGWKLLPSEFKAIFDPIKKIAADAMDYVKDSILGPLKMLRNLRNKLGGKKVAADRKKMKRGGSALKSGLGVGVLAASIATPAFAAQPAMAPLPPFTQSAPAGNSSQTTQHNKFIINAAPGMDEEALARLVAQKIAELDRKKKRKGQGVLRDIED
ncbi:MAG: phage tail tape measure protein, partial [Robiginitomaculum sp.]|nr:phage tail tape measure protein [Robiginitomaculum sp.]